MKRTLLGSMILAGVLLGLGAPRAAGRDDEPEKVSLAALKTALLQKMVAAHVADYIADEDHAARARALADYLGGAANVAGKLSYVYKDKKPSVVFDATKLEKEVGPSNREAALIALKDLVGYALDKVAETSVPVGDDKFTLAKADAKTLAGAVRILWPVPPAVDTSKLLAARLDALVKELEALKKVEARLTKLEKDAPGTGKKLDELAGQVKKIADAIEELKKVLPAVQKLEKSLEPLPAQVKALEGQAKASDDRIKTLEGQAKTSDNRIKALEGQAKTYEDRIKALADRAVKQEKELVGTVILLEKLREETALALKQQRDVVALALKIQRDEIIAATKKRADDTDAALLKQNEEVKILTDKAARADDRLNVQAKRIELHEDRLERGDKERKKVAARLKKIEAILFPPIVQYQMIDRGYYTLSPSQNYGCFGECYPSLTPIWVPWPVYIPIPPKPEDLPEAKLDLPKSTQPTREGPVVPDASVPISTSRTVSGGKTRVRPLRPTPVIVPVYYTNGLKASDAGAIYTRGVQLFQASEFASALARFDAAIRLDGADARFWYFKSLCETALGNTATAAKSLDRAVVLHLQGKPPADKIGQALERIQGPARLQFREALEAQRVRR